MMMLLPPPDVDPLEGAARDTQGCVHGGKSVIRDDITPQRREPPLAWRCVPRLRIHRAAFDENTSFALAPLLPPTV